MWMMLSAHDEYSYRLGPGFSGLASWGWARLTEAGKYQTMSERMGGKKNVKNSI